MLPNFAFQLFRKVIQKMEEKEKREVELLRQQLALDRKKLDEERKQLELDKKKQEEEKRQQLENKEYVYFVKLYIGCSDLEKRRYDQTGRSQNHKFSKVTDMNEVNNCTSAGHR